MSGQKSIWIDEPWGKVNYEALNKVKSTGQCAVYSVPMSSESQELWEKIRKAAGYER